MNDILEMLAGWDRELFLFLNGLHTPVIDPVMIVFSSYTLFAMVMLSITVAMIRKQGRQGVVAAIFFLASVGLSSFVNDVVKTIIMRPRPAHEAIFRDAIHAIGKYEPGYSFYSGHSTTAFCIAVFSILYFRSKMYSALILFWAFCVAYSRIYMGRHYPFDVICGLLAGVFFGFLGFTLYRKYSEKKFSTRS